jgi:hypothetical protein
MNNMVIAPIGIALDHNPTDGSAALVRLNYLTRNRRHHRQLAQRVVIGSAFIVDVNSTMQRAIVFNVEKVVDSAIFVEGDMRNLELVLDQLRRQYGIEQI